MGHRPLETQDSSRGSRGGIHSTTGPEHQRLPFHTFSGSPYLSSGEPLELAAWSPCCLESPVPGVPPPQGPCPLGALQEPGLCLTPAAAGAH